MSGLMVVLGTRPEAIKLLPVVVALRKRGLPVRLVSTGQHRDLLHLALDPDAPAPDFAFDLMRPGASLPDAVGRMIVTLGELFAHERPDRIVVQGDTATALAAAQAAYLLGIPVAHVEAGLRTGALDSPHPEEGIRRMIAAVADQHFAPTETAATALRNEGVDPQTIHVTGNTAIDALLAVKEGLSPADASDRKLIVVTCHRRENFGTPLLSIIEAIRRLSAREDVSIAFVLHPNPAARTPVVAALGSAPNVDLLEPLDFRSFTALLARAHLVLTDSGGVQEEAPALGVPILILRANTERPEGIAAGTAMLVGSDTRQIVAAASRILDEPLLHARMARRHFPYGDGHAAERIADLLARPLDERRAGAA